MSTFGLEPRAGSRGFGRAEWLVVWAACFLLACAPETNLHDAATPRLSRANNPDAEGASTAFDAAVLGPTQLGPLTIEPVADCLHVRASATRPVSAALQITVGERVEHLALGTGAALFDAAFRIDAPGAQSAVAIVTAVDTDGVQLATPPLDVTLPPPAMGFAITEVLANPAGNEATQEYVEIANLAARALSTEGLHIEDGTGADPLPAIEVPPGARLLVVGANFDPRSPTDVHPSPDTSILRVPGRIGRDGLGQKGEIIRLRAADQRTESIYGGWTDTSRSVWAGRSVRRQPESACDHPSVWSRSPQPPTPGW